jgi:hypothetical protein
VSLGADNFLVALQLGKITQRSIVVLALHWTPESGRSPRRWTLAPVHRNVDESMESFVEKVAAKIQESIDERSSSRMVKI